MNWPENTYAASREMADAGAAAVMPRVLFLKPLGASLEAPSNVIAGELLREGWDVSVWPHGAAGRTPAVPGQHPPGRSGVALGKLRLFLGELRSCDVVHIPCDSPAQIIRQALPAIILTRFFGHKPVLHFVSVGVEQLLDRHRRWVAPILRLATCAVAGSRYLQRALGRIGLAARLLPQPIEMGCTTHHIRSKLQPRILVNTRLEPDLNVAAAIRAFRLVKQKYPRAELVVVGSGSQRTHLAELVESSNVKGVDFRGELGAEELSGLYNDCDLFLHCPVLDESPTALVHAFAHGLPVVATDADGLIHMVRDQASALVVPLGDHVGLSDAIIELVEIQELCERLSEQGRAEAEKYLWSRVRQDWVNLYKGVVS